VTIAPDALLSAADVADAVEASPAPARVRLVARAEVRTDARSVLAGLYAAHSAAICRFLKDLLGDATLAADATQETFARAFRRLETLREDQKRLPWLFGIARNVSLEYRKARRVARDRMGPDDALESAAFGGKSPEALLMGHQAARVVGRALADLPEARRAALLLRLDHGLPYDEIAAALGWTVAKAKVEVFRARETLREVLERHEGDAP
jgi:RNA polymerase sigma-70 factor (ECF subfamily)